MTAPAWCFINQSRTAAASNRKAQSAMDPNTTALMTASITVSALL
jgi:hypothetical protein